MDGSSDSDMEETSHSAVISRMDIIDRNTMLDETDMIEKHSVLEYIIIILYIIFVIIVFISNFNILLLFWHSPIIRSSPYNWLVVSMVFSELLGGWLFAPMLTDIIMDGESCVRGITVMCFISFNACTLMLLGIAIYQGKRIIKPLYVWWFDRKSAIQIYIVMSWVVSFVVSIPVIVALALGNYDAVPKDTPGTNLTTNETYCMTHSDPSMQYMVFMSLGILIPAIISVIVINSIIFLIVRKHSKQFLNRNFTTSSSSSAASDIENQDGRSIGKQQEHVITGTTGRYRRQNSQQRTTETPTSINTQPKTMSIATKIKGMKAAKILLLLLFLDIIGWVPLSLLLLVVILTPGLHKEVPGAVLITLIAISSLSSLCNPWIYAFRLPDFKTEMAKSKKTTHCWFCLGGLCCLSRTSCMTKKNQSANSTVLTHI